MKSIIVRIYKNKYRVKKSKLGKSVHYWDGSDVGGRWVSCDSKTRQLIIDSIPKESIKSLE